MKIRNTLKLKKKKIICSTFKEKKSPKTKFELKSEKKKKIVIEQTASPQILKKKKNGWQAQPTSSLWQAQQ